MQSTPSMIYGVVRCNSFPSAIYRNTMRFDLWYTDIRSTRAGYLCPKHGIFTKQHQVFIGLLSILLIYFLCLFCLAKHKASIPGMLFIFWANRVLNEGLNAREYATFRWSCSFYASFTSIVLMLFMPKYAGSDATRTDKTLVFMHIFSEIPFPYIRFLLSRLFCLFAGRSQFFSVSAS